MNELLPYLLKSTLSLSLLYLAFRAIMHKETLFGLNRMVLMTIVTISFIIPLLYLPTSVKPIIQEQSIPQVSIYNSEERPSAAVEMEKIAVNAPSSFTAQKEKLLPYSTGQIIFFIYLSGMLFSFLIFIHGIISVLLLLRKAQAVKKEGYLLFILEKDIPAFSFWRMVFISRDDYTKHSTTILAHEQQHILLGHFYDLMLMEMAKMIHWFNPIIYWLIQDLKAIHEFQADRHTLTKGIDARKYQLLIIEKGVGPQRLALANSFNHCQIKKRITMMNQSKTSKAGIWKVAIFLPLLALLLMAFGKTGENVPPEQQNQEKQWTEADFGKINFQSEKTIWSLHIQLDSKSQLIVGNKITDWKEAAVQIRKYLDYNNTSEEMKPAFEKITINGQERMAQKNTALFIESNISTSRKDYQDFLNSIGNVVFEVRQKYANEIYQTSYNNLSPNQKAEIIRLIPASAMFIKLPVQAVESQKNIPSLYIEVRAEGIFVLPDKNAFSIDELKKRAELFSKENGGFVDVRIAAGLKEENLLQVKEALKGIEKLNIRYLTFDPVYTVVEQMAEFPGGNDGLSDWVSKNTIYPNDAKTNGLEGKVYVSLIINSKGKAVFPKITRELSPELDAEAIRLVTNMPDWKPAIQNGYPVSVSYVMPINFSMK